MLEDTTKVDSVVGISSGFFLGLAVIYGIELLINMIEESFQEKSSSTPPVSQRTYPKSVDSSDLNLSGSGGERLLGTALREDEEDGGVHWESAPVERSTKAIAAPKHRMHIQQHLVELLEAISQMESRACELADQALGVSETEAIAERIDEETHLLQYKLDHCRR